MGQPRLTFPISENSLYPSKATNHTKLPFQLFRTHGGGLTATPPDSSLFRSPHLDAGDRRTPGHDVTAPGTSRGPGGEPGSGGGGAGRTRDSREICLHPAQLRHLPRFGPGFHLSLWRRVLERQAVKERRGAGSEARPALGVGASGQDEPASPTPLRVRPRVGKPPSGRAGESPPAVAAPAENQRE